jgi:hypothetical protein
MEKLIRLQSSLLRPDIFIDMDSLWLASAGPFGQVVNMNSLWLASDGLSGHVSNKNSLWLPSGH